MYSTVKQINDMSMNELGQPLIRSQLLDADADGKLDRLDLHLELRSISGPNRLPIAQSVRQVRVIGTVDYSLQQTVKLDMISLFHITVDTPSGAAHIKTQGELDLL